MNRWKVLASALCVLAGHRVLGQGYGGPLTFQGLERVQVHSVASRGMGAIASVACKDIAVMFTCPSALTSLHGVHVAVAGWSWGNELEQEQNYAPVRYYPNLSLLLEGLTAKIPDPNPELPGFTPADTVQRPYDTLGPNWRRSECASRPLHALVSVPLVERGLKLAVGGGVVQYANLNHFYQNNNVMSPAILSQRPLPTMRPTDDNPLTVDWYQRLRSREGAVWGYGLALAASAEKYGLSLGLSGMLLRGSTDDLEQERARGKLVFFSNAFRADSVYRRISSAGTSEFTGAEFTLNGRLEGRHASVGFALRLPAEITRTYSWSVEVDSTGTPVRFSQKGEDHLRLPWRAVMGISVAPRQNLTIGFEYELRPFSSVRYVDAQGRESSSWLGSSPFRFGVDFQAAPWLALRVGLRNETEVFEPEGNHLPGEPVAYSLYCAGIGISYGGVRVDLACESGVSKYQDIWSSAISKNRQRMWELLGQVSYAFSWGR